MDDPEDLIQRLEYTYIPVSVRATCREAAATIRNLVEERDDLEDRLSLVRVELDNAQKTLARRTVEWTDWKDRAEKAEAYIGGHLGDEVETTIRKLVEERDELLSEVEDMRDMKWQRDAAEDRAEKAEAERDRLKSYLSDAGYQTVQSEQAWRARAEKAEASLAVAVETLERIAAPESCGQPDWSVARAAIAKIKETKLCRK